MIWFFGIEFVKAAAEPSDRSICLIKSMFMFMNSKVSFKSSLFSILFIFSFSSLIAQTYVLGTSAGYTTYRGTVNSNGATLQTCDCPAGKVIVGL